MNLDYILPVALAGFALMAAGVGLALSGIYQLIVARKFRRFVGGLAAILAGYALVWIAAQASAAV